MHLFSSDVSSARQHLFPVLNMTEPGCWAAATPLSPAEDEPLPFRCLCPAGAQRHPQPRDALGCCRCCDPPRGPAPSFRGRSALLPLYPSAPASGNTGLEVFTACKVIKHSLHREAKWGRSMGSGSVLAWKPALPSPSLYLFPGIQPQIPTEGFPPLLLTKLPSCKHVLCSCREA